MSPLLRCASCDHDIAVHQEDGCWFTVETGKPGRDLVCVCTVSRGEHLALADEAGQEAGR